MAVKIGHASISENGTIRGQAGDQGKEVYIRNWYKHSKGWVLLRCTVPGMANYIAEAMEKACKNNNIGYDQLENQTLWDYIKDKGFDPSKADKPVETDCARLVRVCIQYACEKIGNGKTVPDFYTATEASVLVKTGMFEKLTDSKYTTQDALLKRGDVLVTSVKGHTLVCLENGSKAGAPVEVEKKYKLGDRALVEGMEGDDVKEMQSLLMQLGYDLGKWGADGEFGDATEIAVEKFQKDHGCEVDGSFGPASLKALEKALASGNDAEIKFATKVRIDGGDCWVRSAPNTQGKKLGVAKKNNVYPYGGEKSADGWLLIEYKGQNGWVSGKYGELEG